MSATLKRASITTHADIRYQETKSALGNWNIHLMGAYSLLEACGGIGRWATSDRAVAQVGMLTWYLKPTFLIVFDP